MITDAFKTDIKWEINLCYVNLCWTSILLELLNIVGIIFAFDVNFQDGKQQQSPS